MQPRQALWKNGVALEGPDTDQLKGKLRERDGQGVHFSGPGLEAHADAWFDKVSPWLEAENQAMQNINFHLVRLRIVSIAVGQIGGLGIMHLLQKSFINVFRN